MRCVKYVRKNCEHGLCAEGQRTSPHAVTVCQVPLPQHVRLQRQGAERQRRH